MSLPLEIFNIGNTLRALRVETDFSQQNIADALGVDRSTYTYYETGKTLPAIGTLYQIAQIFGVSITDLLVEEALLADPSKHRPKKKAEDKPERIGDLFPEEKTLIAKLRSCSCPVETVSYLSENVKPPLGFVNPRE